MKSTTRFCVLTSDDLYTSKFDEEWKNSIRLDSLHNAYSGYPIEGTMENWIDNFKTVLLNSMITNSSENDENIRAKRCRDFNYWVDYVKYYIQNMKNTKGNIDNEIGKFTIMVEALFKSTSIYKCKREMRDYSIQTHMRKELDDFCENRNHLFTQSTTNETKRKKLIKLIKDKYKDFYRHKLIPADSSQKEGSIFHISDECTLHDITKTFLYYMCHGKTISPSDYWNSYTLKCSPDDTLDNEEYFVSGELSEDSNPPRTPFVIVLSTSLTLLGIALIYFILYKFSPLGTYIHKSKMRKINDNINEFEDNPPFYASNSELRQQYISYYPKENL
ncbi:PIR protein [Plasmodium ovale]|uniref:PIR protein n=1 Tax=Plasmodium ovale TaxID=36330 RepID=A0A1C3KGY8_PLAOA|nr:PIR protein [Plasmodium ovale]